MAAGIWVKVRVGALALMLTAGAAGADPRAQLVQCLDAVDQGFAALAGFEARWAALERLSGQEARCIATLSVTCIAGASPEVCLPPLARLLAQASAVAQAGLPQKLASPPAPPRLSEDFAAFRQTLLAQPLALPCDVPPHLADLACPVLGQGERLLLLRHWRRVVRALEALR